MLASYLLYFFALNDWVVAPDLLGPQLPVVEGTAMLVTVAVHGTEQAPAPARETCKSNLLLAGLAFVLLLFCRFLV